MLKTFYSLYWLGDKGREEAFGPTSVLAKYLCWDDAHAHNFMPM